MTTAYLNGDFQPLEEVRISPLDRGFLFADGVYEVIPVYAGRLFRPDAHLQRLERSLEGIRIDDPLGRAGWRALLGEIVERNGGGNQAVYLQVTRGVAPREHAFPDAASPTVFVMTRKLDGDPPAHGLHAVTRTDIRWSRCDIKSVALLPNVLMRQEAGDSSASEAILIRDGMLTEGTSSNVFVFDGQGLRTPPKSAQILAGITRDVLIELAAAADMECREEPVSETELRAADEIWLSSSTKEVVPVVRLDGRPVGDGAPGAAWRRMHELLQDYKRRLLGGDVD